MTSHSRHVSTEGHGEMGACCEVRGVSSFWAEPEEHSSELEVVPRPKSKQNFSPTVQMASCHTDGSGGKKPR